MKQRLSGERQRRNERAAPAYPLKRTRPLARTSVQATLRRAMANPAYLAPAEVLSLQRAYGNRAVTRILQAKLTVGPADDAYEREADRVAERVVGASIPATASVSGGGGAVAQRQTDEEEVRTKPLVQRRADGGFEAAPALESRLSARRGSGMPLPHDVRAFMEPRFGADFGHVRVHTDGEADRLARAINAKAFTYGSDIYFSAGSYNPATTFGKQLLAHELTHTLQQGASNHIRGWAARGHRALTKEAFKDNAVGERFDEGAQAFLVSRAPDMDFVTDQFRTMQQGRKASKPREKLYNRLLASGETEAARRMFEANELHMRDPDYMMSHGEAGRYKEDNASSTNAAMTRALVSKAVSEWESDNKGRALEILSDALHQAEDRGSHGEGNAFSGHDVRISIINDAMRIRPLYEWEEDGLVKFRRQTGKSSPEGWEPDDMSVNVRGAVVAVRYAREALKYFAQGVQASSENPVSISTEGGPKRRKLSLSTLVGKKWLPSWGGISSGKVGSLKGYTFGGEAAVRQALGRAKLERARAVGAGGGDAEGDIREFTLKQAKAQFTQWKRSRFLRKSKRRKQAVQYWEQAIESAPMNIVTLVDEAIRAAYEQVFGEPLPVKEPEEGERALLSEAHATLTQPLSVPAEATSTEAAEAVEKGLAFYLRGTTRGTETQTGQTDQTAQTSSHIMTEEYRRARKYFGKGYFKFIARRRFKRVAKVVDFAKSRLKEYTGDGDKAQVKSAILAAYKDATGRLPHDIARAIRGLRA